MKTKGDVMTQGYPQGPGQPHQGPPVHVTNNVVVVSPKSTAVAYFLWFFLGQLGIHKFYLNKTGAGIFYLILGISGWATTWIFIGWFILCFLGLLLLIDLFTIPGAVARLNRPYGNPYIQQ